MTRALFWTTQLALASLLTLAPPFPAAAAPAVAPAAPPTAPATSDGRTFGPITITGNRHTAEGIIRRNLEFRQGDPFDLRQIQKAWDRLENLGYFAYVDISYDEEQESGPVALTIAVEEERTFHYYPLINYDRRWKYRLGAVVEDQNFRGRGEVLRLETFWLYTHGYNVTWKRPWFANRRFLEAGLSASWHRAGFVYRPFDFIRWDAGGRIRAWLPQAPLLRRPYVEFEATLTGFNQRETYMEPDPRSGDSLLWPSGWRNRLTLTTTLGVDTRDLVAYPTRGIYDRLIARRHFSDGFDSFSEAILDLRHFIPTTWHHVIALHAWGREIGQGLPPEDRLYWGGPETIRGYDYASLEGEEGWLLSAEYRWPMFLMPIAPDGRVIGVGIHFFWDMGDAWYEGARPYRFPENLRYAPGPLMSWGGGAYINLSSQNFRFEIARTRDGENAFQFEDRFNF
jgi:outer membrane protein assembly factor BamA